MPRPRQQNSVPQLSAGQASYVLDRLVSDRRVSPGEIARYVSEMHREISDLEQRLQSLRTAAGSHGGASGSAGARSGGSTGAGAAGGGMRRRPGRPAGSGRGPGRPAGSGRGPGRPAGSGAGAGAGSASGAASGARRGPGRPRRNAESGAAGGANAGTSGEQGGQQSSESGAGSKAGRGSRKGRAGRSAITPEQLASRQLQGRYLGLIRQIPASRRGQYQKIAKERGREAAIRELEAAVKK